MPFWVEIEVDSYLNIDAAFSCGVLERDEHGRIDCLVVFWNEGDEYIFTGFLARQIHARITGNLMKSADEPKEGGRS